MALGQRRPTTMRSLLRDLVLDQRNQQARKASNGSTIAVTGALSRMGMADLSDVDLIDNPAADGQTLVWSAAENAWVPADAAGATALANLTDVDLSTTPPADGNTLVYDAASSTWVPGAGGGGTLASLTDVDASSFQTGYTLVYSGSNWYATSRALSNLPDVDLSSGLSSGKVLGYNGSKWIPTTRPTTLSGLSDASISSPAAGQRLEYDGSDWVNRDGLVFAVANSTGFPQKSTSGYTDFAVYTIPVRAHRLYSVVFSGRFLTHGTAGSAFVGLQLTDGTSSLLGFAFSGDVGSARAASTGAYGPITFEAWWKSGTNTTLNLHCQATMAGTTTNYSSDRWTVIVKDEGDESKLILE